MKTWIGTWERRGPAGGHFLPGTTAEAAIQTEMDFSKPFLWSSRPHSVSRGFRSFLASWGKGGEGGLPVFPFYFVYLFVCFLKIHWLFCVFLFIDSFIRLLISILWLFIYLSYLFVCLLSIQSYLFIFHLFMVSFTYLYLFIYSFINSQERRKLMNRDS